MQKLFYSLLFIQVIKKSINAIYINIMGIRKHEQNLKTKYIGPERLKSVI